MTTDFAAARADIKAALVDTGIWVPALIKPTGRPALTVYVGYEQPTEGVFGGSVSSQQHAIKYQYSDLPTLAEGDTVSFLDDDGNVIKSRRFKVRAPPIVPVNQLDNSGDGYWRRAELTQL